MTPVPRKNNDQPTSAPMSPVMSGDENDPKQKRRIAAFTQALADLGWTDRSNVRMSSLGGGDDNRIRALAHELVGLQPDILLIGETPATVAVQRETRTIPIVFGNVAEPIASGIARGSTAQEGTSPASPASRPRWEASGLSCSRRSRLGSSKPQSCSIATRAPHPLICPYLRRRPGH